jgi:hypothetical protein
LQAISIDSGFQICGAFCPVSEISNLEYVQLCPHSAAAENPQRGLGEDNAKTLKISLHDAMD